MLFYFFIYVFVFVFVCVFEWLFIFNVYTFDFLSQTLLQFFDLQQEEFILFHFQHLRTLLTHSFHSTIFLSFIMLWWLLHCSHSQSALGASTRPILIELRNDLKFELFNSIQFNNMHIRLHRPIKVLTWAMCLFTSLNLLCSLFRTVCLHLAINRKKKLIG